MHVPSSAQTSHLRQKVRQIDVTKSGEVIHLSKPSLLVSPCGLRDYYDLQLTRKPTATVTISVRTTIETVAIRPSEITIDVPDRSSTTSSTIPTSGEPAPPPSTPGTTTLSLAGEQRQKQNLHPWHSPRRLIIEAQFVDVGTKTLSLLHYVSSRDPQFDALSFQLQVHVADREGGALIAFGNALQEDQGGSSAAESADPEFVAAYRPFVGSSVPRTVIHVASGPRHSLCCCNAGRVHTFNVEKENSISLRERNRRTGARAGAGGASSSSSRAGHHHRTSIGLGAAGAREMRSGGNAGGEEVDADEDELRSSRGPGSGGASATAVAARVGGYSFGGSSNAHDAAAARSIRPVLSLAHVIVIEVSCGASHSLALDSMGIAYFFGDLLEPRGSGSGVQKAVSSGSTSAAKRQSPKNAVATNNVARRPASTQSWWRVRQAEPILSVPPESIVRRVVCGHSSCGLLVQESTHGATMVASSSAAAVSTTARDSPQSFLGLSPPTSPVSQATQQQANRTAGAASGTQQQKNKNHLSLYTWGRGSPGVLGHGSYSDEHEPRRVASPWLGEGECISQVQLGRAHMVCLSGEQVLTCGHPDDGRLGRVVGRTSVLCPVKFPRQFVDLAEAEMNASAQEGEEGEEAVKQDFSSADGSAGQVGESASGAARVAASSHNLAALPGTKISSRASTVSDRKPGPASASEPQKDYSMGQAFNRPAVFARFCTAGGAHTAIIDKDLSVWIWGCNRFGQLGLGNSNLSDMMYQAVPRRVRFLDGKGVCGVSLGDRHSCALTLYGLVYAWGANDSLQCGGQGGKCGKHMPHLVTELIFRPVVQVACGELHTFVLAGQSHDQKQFSTHKLKQWRSFLLKKDAARRKVCEREFEAELRKETLAGNGGEDGGVGGGAGGGKTNDHNGLLAAAAIKRRREECRETVARGGIGPGLASEMEKSRHHAALEATAKTSAGAYSRHKLNPGSRLADVSASRNATTATSDSSHNTRMRPGRTPASGAKILSMVKEGGSYTGGNRRGGKAQRDAADGESGESEVVEDLETNADYLGLFDPDLALTGADIGAPEDYGVTVFF